MYYPPEEERLAHTFRHAAQRLDIPENSFRELVQQHDLRWFRVKRTKFLPEYELRRLMTRLLCEQAEKKGHGDD